MKQLIRGRHTPAMAVAVLALVAAVTGAAVANPGAHSSVTITKKKVKKIAKSVADQEIAKLAPSLSVKAAGTAGTAGTADKLSMFAQVASGGGFVGSRLGVGSVSHPTAGIYCFSGLARQPVGGEATVDYDDSATNQFAQFGLGQDISLFCPGNTQAFVATYHLSGTNNASLFNAGFFVEMW
jgi:hypothetical protein